jgi:hypothetical protein
VADRLSAYFDPTAFVGRNILRGTKQIDTDLSIMKDFRVTESQQLEFCAKLFNLFNNVNFDNPINIASSGNFGQIVDTTTGPRVIQFALKYMF